LLSYHIILSTQLATTIYAKIFGFANKMITPFANLLNNQEGALKKWQICN